MNGLKHLPKWEREIEYIINSNAEGEWEKSKLDTQLINKENSKNIQAELEKSKPVERANVITDTNSNRGRGRGRGRFNNNFRGRWRIIIEAEELNLIIIEMVIKVIITVKEMKPEVKIAVMQIILQMEIIIRLEFVVVFVVETTLEVTVIEKIIVVSSATIVAEKVIFKRIVGATIGKNNNNYNNGNNSSGNNNTNGSSQSFVTDNNNSSAACAFTVFTPHSCSYMSDNKNNNSEWLLDSGASSHFTGDRSLLENIVKLDEPLVAKTGNGISNYSEIGDIKLQINDKMVTLKEVIYIPQFSANLISAGRIVNKNTHNVLLDYNGVKIINKNNNEVYVSGIREGNMFKINETCSVSYMSEAETYR